MAGKTNKFMKNLVAVAVDECHLIWDWEGFRHTYQFLGTLRSVLDTVPWACLSATLTPTVAAYVHEVCQLRSLTVRFHLSCRRNNINIAVCPIASVADLMPLCELIPAEVPDLPTIPKTVIFHDGIDRGQEIADALRARLASCMVPPPSGTVPLPPPNVMVQLFYSSLDDEAKKKTLDDIRSGKCRIAICTDAFGLGVDIRDIRRVIQWNVDERLSVFSLTQRIGRAARNPYLTGDAIIYVNKSVLEAVSQDWQEAWCADSPSDWSDDDEAEDNPRIIPVSKKRQLERFSLPVEEGTRDQIDNFLRHIYTEVKNVREAHRLVKKENRGTKKNKLMAAQKIDPAVLWVLCTAGCRLKAILSVFKDSQVWVTDHKAWCCDHCAHRDGRTPDAVLETSISYLRTNSESNKIILLSKIISVPDPQQYYELSRPPICDERLEVLKKRLYKLRIELWKTYNLPSSSLQSIVLPDEAIDRIVKDIKRIQTVTQLKRALQAVRFDIDSSLLSDHHLTFIVSFIEKCLASSIHMEQPCRGMSPIEHLIVILVGIVHSREHVMPLHTHRSPPKNTQSMQISPSRGHNHTRSPRKIGLTHKRARDSLQTITENDSPRKSRTGRQIKRPRRLSEE
jgi:hypothetical protein